MLAACKFLAFQTCEQGSGNTDPSDAAHEVLCWRLATSSKRHTFSPQQSPSTSSCLTGPVYLHCLPSVPCRHRAKLSHKPSLPTPSFLSHCPCSACMNASFPNTALSSHSSPPSLPSPALLSPFPRPFAPATLLFLFFLLWGRGLKGMPDPSFSLSACIYRLPFHFTVSYPSMSSWAQLTLLHFPHQACCHLVLFLPILACDNSALPTSFVWKEGVC